MGRALWLWIFWLFLVTTAGSDWLNCPPQCVCKWSSGKKTASCVSAGLTTPPMLSSDIQVLDLHGNPLRSLQQDAFARIGLLNLQRVNLSSANLKELHGDTFRELRILIEVDLSQNELHHLSPDTFRGNERLRLLILNDNPLKSLIAEQFPALPHLKRLEISKCKLNNIHPFAFIHLKALETLQVHQNSLSYLHQNTFNLPLLKTLILSENPWNCDCRLKEFHAWFLNTNLGNEEVFCENPKGKSQMPWRSLKSYHFVCPPEAIASPTVIRTEAGADITFGCFARGDPKPEINWFFHSVAVVNETYKESDISINKQTIEHFDEYNQDLINKSAEWVNVTINNVTSELAGEWMCKARSPVGVAKVYLTLVLPKARIATARSAPDYSAFFAVGGSILAFTALGFVAACLCWKTRNRHVPSSRSFTDQEKKLLDTSIAASCDRTSADRSSYGFELLDRSLSMDSEDTNRLDPVHITIEPNGMFPPPPAEFALPAPYGNIFISVQVSGRSEDYPDLLGGGATLPRRSRTCFLKSDYDNMGPRVTAAGSSVWSLPGSKVEGVASSSLQETIDWSAFSTEFTAL